MSDEAANQAPEESKSNEASTVELSRAELAKLEERANKLDEFRENNRELHNQLKQFEGIDPSQVKKLQEERQKLLNRLEAKEKGVDDEELEELLNKRYGQAIEKEREKYNSLEETYKSTSEKLREVLLDNEVTMASKSLDDFVGPATQDAIRLVREHFEVKDGQAVHKDGAHDEDGKPLTVAKFISWTKKQGSEVYRPHWWKATASGGGATGNQGTHTGQDVMSRSDFERMQPNQKMEFMRKVKAGKAKLVDAA